MPEDGKVNVLHVGLGYERKRIHHLVDALAELGPQKFRLVRVGPGRNPAYVQAYRSRASAVGLELVECGFVPDDTLAAYYGYADLFVFPSADEGAGIPPLEAMACGTNVVVSDLPAHREMCGDLAFYASPEPGGLAAAIAKALEGSHPADTLRRHAAKFTWSRTAETYLRLYSEVGAA
jgi:glycosyltransferase involved in cell wall biosynthesis